MSNTNTSHPPEQGQMVTVDVNWVMALPLTSSHLNDCKPDKSRGISTLSPIEDDGLGED